MLFQQVRRERQLNYECCFRDDEGVFGFIPGFHCISVMASYFIDLRIFERRGDDYALCQDTRVAGKSVCP